MKLASSGGFAAMLRRYSGFHLGKSTPSSFSSSAKNSALLSIPARDQWIEEGYSVSKQLMQKVLDFGDKEIRMRCAYQISQWENDKSKPLSKTEMVVRLASISGVYGGEQVERFFHLFPEESRSLPAYCLLLQSYVQTKSLEKAELTIQKMRELGFPKSAMPFDLILTLYFVTEEYDKLHMVLHEIEEEGIKFNYRMFNIVLGAYRQTSDADGVCRILKKMESYQQPDIIWSHYSMAADVFTKVGDSKKALEALKLAENCAVKDKGTVFYHLMKQYAALGKKEDVLRIWEGKKKFGELDNLGYVGIISSLLKFDDIEGAEGILEDWLSSRRLPSDFCVPNFLIGFYCSKGLMEKANHLIDRTKAKGGKPLPRTWDFMASGYAGLDKMEEAVNSMKLATRACKRGWKPSTHTLASCFEYLKKKGIIEEGRDFLRSVLRKDIISQVMHDQLVDYMKNDSAVDGKALEILKLSRDGC